MKTANTHLRSLILMEMKRLRERTEGVVEHDNRFDQMMNILVELMNEYQMDPKAISQLAARRIYEKFPKPPWVNDADAHTLKGDDGGTTKQKPEAKSGEAKKGPAPKEVEESSMFWENILREVEAVYDEDLPGDKDSDVDEVA